MLFIYVSLFNLTYFTSNYLNHVSAETAIGAISIQMFYLHSIKRGEAITPNGWRISEVRRRRIWVEGTARSSICAVIRSAAANQAHPSQDGQGDLLLFSLTSHTIINQIGFSRARSKAKRVGWNPLLACATWGINLLNLRSWVCLNA